MIICVTMDIAAIFLTVLGTVVGIAISILKKKYKHQGQGIAIGSLVTGLPLIIFGSTGVGSASFSLSEESQSSLKSLESEIERLKTELKNKITFGQSSGGMLDTGNE